MVIAGVWHIRGLASGVGLSKTIMVAWSRYLEGFIYPSIHLPFAAQVSLLWPLGDGSYAPKARQGAYLIFATSLQQIASGPCKHMNNTCMMSHHQDKRHWPFLGLYQSPPCRTMVGGALLLLSTPVGFDRRTVELHRHQGDCMCVSVCTPGCEVPHARGTGPSGGRSPWP